MNIPEGTTHVWTPAVDKCRVHYYVRLPFFKRKLSGWCVYSDVSGWRMTANTPEWFAKEKRNGYFVTITKFNSPGFLAKKEVV